MKTLRITVCDDDTSLRNILKEKIQNYCEKEQLAYQINSCESGEKLLSLTTEKMPDILFLDIQMPGKNGMETARLLRLKSDSLILIFVTALPEYVYEAFDVSAFYYLVKPFDDGKLYQVLDRAIHEYIKQTAGDNKQTKTYENPTQRAILVKRSGLSTKVFLSDIIYAEVFNRKVLLHTVNGDLEYYGKLTALSEQAGADFYRTHRAYLVNLKYVEKYNADTIWLEKDTIPVSKKQFAGFVRHYMQYIARTNRRGTGQ